MNLAAIPRKTTLGKLIRLPLRLVPKDAVMRVLQGPMRGARWIVGSAPHGCWTGHFEYAKQRAFASVIKPGSVVYDLGANVGFYSVLAARCGASLVVACEPDPKNIALLREHLRLNRITNVVIEQIAVCDKEGDEAFEFRGCYGAFAESGPTVTTVTLDSLLRKYPRPDVIKMDVEGAELRVLQGATKVLESHPTVFVVFDFYDRTRAPGLELMAKAGYQHKELADGDSIFHVGKF